MQETSIETRDSVEYEMPRGNMERLKLGLQNRCTTTVLTRHFNDLGGVPVERFC